MAISLEEINALVWRYLSENGFQHTAFLFKEESMVDTSDSLASQIPSNSLISILQKSILYSQLEKQVCQARNDSDNRLHSFIMELEKKYPDISPAVRQDNAPENENAVLHPLNLRISSAVASILTGHRLCVFSCRWSPDGQRLGTASEDGTAIIWKMKDGIPVDRKVLGNQSDNTPFEKGITAVDWGCNGKYFATASFDSLVKVYTCDGEVKSILNAHKHNVFAIAFNPAGTMIVTCSADKTAMLWSVPNGQFFCAFNHHNDTIMDVQWQDNQTFATASADSNIGICKSNGKYWILSGHSSQVTAIAWNDAHTFLASASEDKTVRVWGIESSSSIVLKGHESGVSCVKWVSNNLIVSAAQDGSVRIWDIPNPYLGTCIAVIKHHTQDVISLDVSPCKEYIATGGTDQSIDIIRVSDGEVFATLLGSSAIFEVKWDPSGKYLAACFDDSTVAVIPIEHYLK